MKHKKNGFTFIELVIVTGIISISLPMIFGLFFLNLRNQTKIISLQEVKRNGDNALATIETLIKNNAKSIMTEYGSSTEICNDSIAPTPPPSSEMGFISVKNDAFGFSLDQNRIASSSSVLAAPVYLTNGNVQISNLLFSCENTNQFIPPVVSVSFTVSKGVAGEDATEKQATLDYSAKILLRN